MSEYIASYRKNTQQVSAEPPACAEGKDHCWHSPNTFSGYFIIAQGYDETCCWCGCVKENRRNPEAHGPYNSNRSPAVTYGGAFLGQSNDLLRRI